MNDSKIAVRYSRALFQLAVEKNLLDNVFQDMIYISGLCRIDEVKEVIDSPIIVPSKKKIIFSSLLEKNVEKITLALVNLLLTNGREDYLPAVARNFRDATLKYRGITETTLITAVPVNDAIRKQISTLVTSVFNTKVELTESVDEGIIGGFILKVDDNYMDASVKTKLRRIKRGLAVRTGGKEE